LFFLRYAADVDAEADVELKVLRQAWEKASNGERDNYLLDALWLCAGRLPDWLYHALNEILTARLPKALVRDRTRWRLVKEGRSLGLTFEQSYERASKEATGISAGSPRTMKAGYLTVQHAYRK
jgi:hypothetical protein